MMKQALVCCAVAAASLCASARTQEISAWRGETVTERIDDAIELGKAPNGIGVRLGVLRSVKAAPEPGSLQRVEVLDRVEWTKNPKGARVIEVSVPADAEPGVYKCGMIDIRVVDRTLPPPREWKYYLDLWQHPWAVARMAHAEPFTLLHYEAMRPLWRTLAEAGQKTLTVTLVDEPWNHQCHDAYRSMIGRKKVKETEKVGGESRWRWKFDYKVFDTYVEFGRECGLGPDISCYTMCPWGYVCRYHKEGVGEVAVKAVPGTPEFEDFWGDFLVDFAKHLKEKGWFKDTLIAMDERSPDDVKKIAEFIQKKAPGMRISMAGNRKPSDFEGITIDSYSQVLREGNVSPAFLAEAAERRAKGFITTHYVCCSPRHPNTFLESKEGEAFWCGVYPAMAGLDGFLRWAYNSWPVDPMADGTFGPWLAGDTYFVYPNGEPSWRFLELKRGVVAAEKIRLLRARGLLAEELDALAKRFDVEEANAGKADFKKLRDDVIATVNK